MQPIQPPPRAVIFDLDGTLADTFSLIVTAWNAAMEKPLGRRFEPAEVISRFGVPDAAMIRRELQELPETIEEAIETYFHHYATRHDVVRPFSGITEMLHTLRDCKMPLGVMTGKGRRATEITLRELGWQGIFGSVITGEHVTEQKPHPEGVLRAARELGAEPARCVFVGDSPADIKAGQAAGMVTVAAAWHAVYLDRLRPLQPDYWAEAPADLTTICGVS